jgi:hypothetical protein
VRFKDENGWDLWSYDHATGVSVWHYFDGQNNHWRTDTPVDAVLKANREDGAARAGRRHHEGIGELVARVPLSVFFDRLNDPHRSGDTAHLSRWLNDGDNAAFRVREGRV